MRERDAKQLVQRIISLPGERTLLLGARATPRVKRRVHSVPVETINSDKDTFREGGRDARAPSFEYRHMHCYFGR